MATFFGEVLPTFSRAVGDDEDEEEIIETSSPLKFMWLPRGKSESDKNPEKRLNCKQLIVTVDPTAAAFADVYLLKPETERLGIIYSDQDEKESSISEKTAPPIDKACSIYRLPKKKEALLIRCNLYVAPDQMYAIVEQMFSKVGKDLAQVVLLCSSPACEFQCEGTICEESIPFLRCLRTSCTTGPIVSGYLEQPNVVAGLPGQILSYCEVHRIPAVLYVCYTGSLYLDSESIKLFLQVFQTESLRHLLQDNPKANEQLRHIIDKQAQQNPLYI